MRKITLPRLSDSDDHYRRRVAMSDTADSPVTSGSGSMEAAENRLRSDLENLQAAHNALLERIRKDGEHGEGGAEELNRLRERVKELEKELAEVSGERDELNSTIRDLRVRVEESRRAIMRLQGRESTVSAGVSHATETNAAAHNKQDARRSMLASWNPREVQAGLGVITTTPASPPAVDDANPATQDPEELAELKKSKRASLAFGPHAQNTMARRLQGHRRIASGSKIGAEEGGESSLMPPPPISAGGLRELHLGSATVGPSSAQTNKRASILGTGVFRATTPDSTAESNGEERGSTSLLIPSRASRRASNSSSVSGPSGDSDNVLAPPLRVHSRISPSPSHSSIASPIRERDDFIEEDEPATATALTPGLLGQQQQSAAAQASYQMQRSIMEGKARLRDRDDQINHMKRELAALRMQLDEANDARAASDACLSALRDFVKNEGSGENADMALKGVMLPPLPTDKDNDDDGAQPVLAPSAWRSIGSTIAGLSRKSATGIDEKDLPAMPSDPAAGGGPMSPSTQIASSFGNLWSRATATSTVRDSISASSVTPSEGASLPAESFIDSRHTSIVSSPGNETAVQNANSSPSAAFRGFNWFSKRAAAGNTTDSAHDNLTASPSAVRVSSPPFANLDNHVINLDQVATPTSMSARTASFASANGSHTGSRKASVGSTAGTAPSVNGGEGREPSARTKKAMEKSEAVDEDSGFVPPSF